MIEISTRPERQKLLSREGCQKAGAIACADCDVSSCPFMSLARRSPVDVSVAATDIRGLESALMDGENNTIGVRYDQVTKDTSVERKIKQPSEVTMPPKGRSPAVFKPPASQQNVMPKTTEMVAPRDNKSKPRAETIAEIILNGITDEIARAIGGRAVAAAGRKK